MSASATISKEDVNVLLKYKSLLQDLDALCSATDVITEWSDEEEMETMDKDDEYIQKLEEEMKSMDKEEALMIEQCRKMQKLIQTLNVYIIDERYNSDKGQQEYLLKVPISSKYIVQSKVPTDLINLWREKHAIKCLSLRR